MVRSISLSVPQKVSIRPRLRLLAQGNEPRQKDLIAFGDEHNDTEMLAFAGKGYAMKNANPELLPYADEQISLTNDQDGVAKTLQDLFL